VSPWYNSGPSAATFGVWAAVWLIIVQWLSAALGGYLTGRLRTKWVGVHTDEVYFRDTAHGFLAWAVAAVIMAAVLSSGLSSAAGSVARAVGLVAGAAAPGAGTAAAQSGDFDPTGISARCPLLFRRSRCKRQSAGGSRRSHPDHRFRAARGGCSARGQGLPVPACCRPDRLQPGRRAKASR
jgi:hypothetical protein